MKTVVFEVSVRFASQLQEVLPTVLDGWVIITLDVERHLCTASRDPEVQEALRKKLERDFGPFEGVIALADFKFEGGLPSENWQFDMEQSMANAFAAALIEQNVDFSCGGSIDLDAVDD